MYTLEFIQPLVVDAAKKIKLSSLTNYPTCFEKDFSDEMFYKNLPDFNPVYKESVKQHNKIAIHSTIDIFPYQILKSKAPNQSEREWEYQMGLYESITTSTWDRAKSKTKIISNEQNYSINWKNEDQKKYFYQDYPVYHNIESFFFDIVRDRKIDFPNQVLLIKPKEIPGEFAVIENDEIVFNPNQTVEVEPIVIIIEEQNIIQYKNNDYLLILSEDKSKYQANGRTYDDGLIFEFYDKNNIWYFIQEGQDENGTAVFSAYNMYNHNWGWLPARKLQGKPVMFKDEVLFHSIFVDAVPILNTVIRLWSNMIMNYYSNAFTRMMIVVDDCGYTSREGEACDAGRIYDHTKQDYITCPQCKGTGDNIQDGPTGIYKVRLAKRDTQLPMTPPIQFAEPDPAILKESRDYIDQLKQDAFSFIYKAEQAKSDTATGDQLQEQDFQSMLIHFSNELWDLMEFAIECMGFLRYGNEFEMPDMLRPTFFNFRTPSDLTDEIGKAKENKLPETYMKPLVTQAVKTRMNSDNYAAWAFELQTKVDILWNMDTLDVQAALGRTCSKEHAILHNSFTSILEWVISTTGNDLEAFKAKSIQDQYDLLMKRASEISAQIQSTNSLPVP